MKFLSALLVLSTLFLAPAYPAANYTARISVASDGAQGNSASTVSSVSAHARFIAFESHASNLVSGDTNYSFDIFVHERETGQTSRVSVASDGAQGDQSSSSPSISADGGYVAFESCATNLISNDTNGWLDVFVRNLGDSQIYRVSIASDGAQGDGSSGSPSISMLGYYVAFHSYATNLVSGDTNMHEDVFFHNLGNGQTSRVSIASDGTQGDQNSEYPSISADGSYVVFHSYATNLVGGDTNGMADIFIHNVWTGQTSRVSVASDGTQGNDHSHFPDISADGRYVAFQSDATNLVDDDTNGQMNVFVHDLWTGRTSRVSIASNGVQGDDDSGGPSISGDGRYVAFTSSASNLISGDTNGKADVFVHDLWTGQTNRVSLTDYGVQGDNFSNFASISMDGYYIAFTSEATNLVGGDTNGVKDIFLYIPLFQLYLPLVTQP